MAAGDIRPPSEDQPPKVLQSPMWGRKKLAAVAILGRARIMELASKPVTFIWDDIAQTGIIVVIAGGPGCGKTTLLFFILTARLNRGEAVKLLGRSITPAPDGKYVVVIEAEHSARSSARKLTQSCRRQGIGLEALDRVILVARRSVRIGSPEWEDVGALVADGLVSDVALDTLARVAPADANNEAEQVEIFEQIARMIDRAPTEETKPVAWVVAHTRKSETAELSDVSGSTQRVGQADTVLLVTASRRDGRVVSSKVTFAKLREEPDEYPSPVEYSITKTRIVEDAESVTDDRSLDQRILDRLALGPQTKSGLATHFGRNKKDVDAALTTLFEAHHIETTTVTIKGSSYKAFCLSGEPGLDAGRVGTPYGGR